MFLREGKRNSQFFPNEIICHVLGYIQVNENKPLQFMKVINNCSLVNTQFCKCVKQLFDNTFYKDLLFKTFTLKPSLELKQINERNNYKSIYSYLKQYFKSDEHYQKQHKNNKNPLKHKITMFGDAFVGKSSITIKFVKNMFVDEYEEREAYFLNTSCIISICDLTKSSTLVEVVKNIETFYKIRERNDLPIVIVGNKLDLIEEENKTREITKEMIDEIIERVCRYSILKPIYIETSAKTGHNINEVFIEAVRLIKYTPINWNNVI